MKSRSSRPARLGAATALLAALVLAGCSRTPAPAPSSPESTALSPVESPAASRPESSATGKPYSKVLLLVEENHDYGQVIGDPDAPYLNELAATYGSARHLDAGYPPNCPSLAAYILLTSGTTDGICDDRAPRAHPLQGDNVFHQVSSSGREWRNYAESAPGTCVLDNAADGRYLVRHVPATYFQRDRADCARWAVPLGQPADGTLHADVAAGTLPAFGFVTPDACNDMHGAAPCPTAHVAQGDRWLRDWLPQILAGPDYSAGRLVVIITWDEGTATDNHIPTLVIAPTAQHVVADQPYTHCSTLRTVEEILGLPLLGCARTAASLSDAFRLTRG